MIRTLVNSGLLNTTFLAAVAAAVWLVVQRPAKIGRRVQLTSIAVLMAGSSMALVVALYRGYAVPRDVMQDIVAAREFAAGRPMHPSDMSAKIGEALDESGPRRSLLWWHPEFAAQEDRQRKAMLGEHWVQAHPPFVTLLTVPFVSTIGVQGTQAVYAFASLAALVVSLALCYRLFGIGLWSGLAIASFIAAFGWSAAVSAVRLQQLGLILAGLLIVGWACLRSGRNALAGVCVGLAVGLKLIPGVLLLPLMVRHRGASVAAMLTLAAIGLAVFAIVPQSDLEDYHATTSGVIDDYAAYTTNISALGFYARGAAYFGLPLSAAKAFWVGTLGAVGLLWANGLFHRSRTGPRDAADIDLEFAVGLSIIPLLSPVAWDHYEVFLLQPMILLARHVRTGQPFERAAFGLLLIGIALPDATILWIDELLAGRWQWVSVFVVQPLRTYAAANVACWTALLFRRSTTRGEEQTVPA